MQDATDSNGRLTLLPPMPIQNDAASSFISSIEDHLPLGGFGDIRRPSPVSSAHTEKLSQMNSAQGTQPLSRCAAMTPSREPETPQAATSSDTIEKHPNNGNGNDNGNIPTGLPTPHNPKVELREEDVWPELGFSFSPRKKWTILTIVFLVQLSMNFNTTLYSNGLAGISQEFGVSMQAARVGAAAFLIAYAFGCELWAPWSEELGRKPILQASLFLVNIWCILVALAPNFGALIVGRVLGGLSSAGGSVTLGMIADMYEPDEQQNAVAYIVFSSVAGSILGPVIGGFVETYLDWRWTIWIQLIFGGFVQLLHLLFVPETRSTILLDRIAKDRRKAGLQVYGPNELRPLKERFTLREFMWTWYRSFHILFTEPIVLVLSALSGFSDALIFMQVQSFVLVYSRWGFSAIDIGLSFIPIGIGYVIAWISFLPSFKRIRRKRDKNTMDEHAQFESRLWWLLYTAPCLPIGLFIFAWTSGGPPVHWVGSMVGSAIIGIANYAIYMATIDYMIGAYGPYAASATGGNGWARDILAGILTVPATPFYENIGLEHAGTILAGISVLLVPAVYLVYFKGPWLRKRSPFAQSLVSAETTDPRGHPHISIPLQDRERLEAADSQSRPRSPGEAMDDVARAPNPRIVVTSPVDSRPNTREGGGQEISYDYNDNEEHDVSPSGSGRVLSGETEIGDDDSARFHHC